MFKVLMLLVSMLLSVFCHPLVTQAQQDEAAMMATAKGHYQEGGYYYASTWLERILRNWPATAQREEILLMMAKSYAATGREDKAARTVETLLKDYPQAAVKLDQDILKLVRAPDLQVGEAPIPVAAAAPALAQPAAPSQAVPDAARQNAPVAHAEPAPAKAADEANASAPAEAPIKPDALKPAVAVGAKPAVEEAATPAIVEVANPAATVAATNAPAPLNPVALPAEALTGGETETACRDSSATDPGTYAIELGAFIGKNALARGKRAVEKAGLMPVVGPGPQKVEVMLRILVGEFSDESAAKKVLNKLRKAGAEQFMLKDKGGVFRIYAGSYFEHQAALDEQKRLLGKGIPSELKEATVAVSTFVINAGCFPTEEVAKVKLAELERLGMKGKVMR